MWRKPFEASVKNLRVAMEGDHRICTVVLGLEWGPDLTDGVAGAREADAALRRQDYQKVTIRAEADCRAQVTAPAHDGDAKQSLTIPECHLRTIDLVAHEDKDGDVEVIARPALVFRPSDAALVFFCHHLGRVTLRFKLELRQLSLPAVDGGKAKA